MIRHADISWPLISTCRVQLLLSDKTTFLRLPAISDIFTDCEVTTKHLGLYFKGAKPLRNL